MRKIKFPKTFVKSVALIQMESLFIFLPCLHEIAFISMTNHDLPLSDRDSGKVLIQPMAGSFCFMQVLYSGLFSNWKLLLNFH